MKERDMIRFIVASASLALAGTAFAQTEQPRERTDQSEANATHHQQGEEKGERLICRRLAPAATGSAMGHRRCLTAAQWRAINRAR
jgi:hypothetical protein